MILTDSDPLAATEPDCYFIGVTGSRNWKKYGIIERALRFTAYEAQLKGLRPLLAVGDCPTGADWIATQTWRSWQWEPQVFYADWDNCTSACPRIEHRKRKRPGDKHHPGALDTFCPKAGPRRNVRLVGSGLHVLLAFPMAGSTRSGTWHCINVARGAGVEVVLPDRWQ